jgi:hypothetical protein
MDTDTNNSNLWSGQFSICNSNGQIMKFINNYLKNKDVLFLIFYSDGDIQPHFVDHVLNKLPSELKNKKLIVGTLGEKNENHELQKIIKYLYMPLDDVFFSSGVTNCFNNLPPWESRKSIVFWRGGVSGGDHLESIRCRTVAKLLNYPDTDVKVNHGWEPPGNIIPDTFFGERVDYTELLNYKTFIILDGNCIASAHMWGFGSGGVPFLISNATCWFSKFLKPFVNYIPIKYDLSNLIEQIEWVRNNDAEAKKIAENALKFAKEVFSPEFQRKYLMNEIDEYLKQ